MKKRKPIYRRVLLKLGGESLRGKDSSGVDPAMVYSIAGRVQDVHKLGVEIAIVIGGGNIFRGAPHSEAGMDRATADYMGMLATVINALALQDALERVGLETRVQTPLVMEQIAEPYIRRRAIRHLEKERVVIFAGGTGNPYFTTDTAAALRAIEINAEVILKATKVDGVYTSDPLKNRRARRFSRLSHMEAIRRKLDVLDSTALSLCMDNNLPIVVFNLTPRHSIRRVIEGENIGTFVTSVKK